MAPRQIALELLPQERAILLKWNYTPEVREQLEACASSAEVATIRLTPTDIRWLAGDLTHTIVKRGCRGQDVFDLSERLDYVDESGDGPLAGWY